METNTFTDTVTGLVWSRNTQSNATRLAAVQHCQGLAATSEAGRDDWRVPKLYELVSLVDYGRDTPALPSALNPFMESKFHWAVELVANQGVGVNFTGGIIGRIGKEVSLTNVGICVSGVPAGELIDTGCDPETVRDTRTNLEWDKRAMAGGMEWSGALAACANRGEGWRLPTLKELMTIFEPTQDPAYVPAFAGEPGDRFWTSTPNAGATNSWRVHFGLAPFPQGDGDGVARSSSLRVRCVRSL